MTHIAVIGAGIVGASVAYRLVQGGADVTLIDQGQPGAGTTSRSFAWLNANRKTPRAYFDLNVAGMREHRALAEELPPGDWLHACGNLIWPDCGEKDELQERIDRLRDWGYAAEWRDATSIGAELEPHLALQDLNEQVAFFPGESWVDAPQLTSRIINAARSDGFAVRTGTGVTGVSIHDDRVEALTLDSGDRIAVDGVVNAAGVGAAAISQMAGAPLPMAPTRGLLVRLRVEGDPIRRVIHTPAVNLRPDGPGRVLLHHDSTDAELGDVHEIDARDPLVQRLVDAATAVAPALGGATFHDARIGVRPITIDGYPSVGALPGVNGYYEAVTHSGVTLGPLLGRLLAAEILSGVADPVLATFRPERFGR